MFAILLTSFGADARARRASADDDSDSGWQGGFASIVVDAKTGKVLQETKADMPRHPASLTKIMTLYLLFEQIEAGRIRLDQKMTISQHAADQAPTKLDLDPGEKIEVEDAIKALITRSANDVAVAIAEAIAGDEDAFAILMTKKARALGMSGTTFRNASGLPDKEQITTARDLALLGRAIQDRFPRLYRYFSLKTFLWRGEQIANHNRLINRDGVDGIKTGYTRASGFNLVTSVKLNNRAIVAVVLGGASAGARDERMRELIDAYLPKAYAGERTLPLIAEAPPTPPPARAVARIATVPAPGSREPMRPSAVRTITVAKSGDTQTPPEQKPRTLGVLRISPFGNVTAAPLQPLQISSYAAGTIDVTPPVTAPATPEAQSLPLEQRVAAAVRPQSEFVPAPVAPPLPAATLSPTTPPAPAATGKDQSQASPPPRVAPVAVASITPTAVPDSVIASRPGWHIQIGAYTNEGEAKGKLAAARERLTGLLARAESYTEKTVKGSVEYVRARFAGFSDEAEARKTCEALKKNDFACIPVKN
ncbi:MAG TPA: serine hydrolase [Xanthobacteraceae bacterium]|nr:serine hydrolase [Xanthobacteraceae bacterium]